MSFFQRIFSSKILPSWTIFLFDAVIVALSVVFAYFVRFPAADVLKMGSSPWAAIAIITVIHLACFKLFRTYEI